MVASQRISQSYRLATTQLPPSTQDDGWMRQPLPAQVGECYSERLAFAEDLLLVRSHYRPTRHLIEETASPHGRPMLVITFGLHGHSGYKGADGCAVAFNAGFTTVTAFQRSLGERHYAADTRVTQLRLLIGESTLNHYIGEQRTRQLLGNGHVRQLAYHPTSSASTHHAHALTQGMNSALDRHIHSLSLLAEQLKHLSPEPFAPGPQWGAADIEKLERARDIMFEQLDQPLTVAYLCAAVGLNEFKLKQGWHHRFNTTPHRMLLEMRMRKAHTLLKSGCQVAQAAYQVGYAFPSNFSAAFARFFGQTPKAVFGKRR